MHPGCMSLLHVCSCMQFIWEVCSIAVPTARCAGQGNAERQYTYSGAVCMLFTFHLNTLCCFWYVPEAAGMFAAQCRQPTAQQGMAQSS